MKHIVVAVTLLALFSLASAFTASDFFGTWDQSCTFYGNVSQGGLTGYLYSTDTFTFKSPNIFSIQINLYAGQTIDPTLCTSAGASPVVVVNINGTYTVINGTVLASVDLYRGVTLVSSLIGDLISGSPIIAACLGSVTPPVTVNVTGRTNCTSLGLPFCPDGMFVGIVDVTPGVSFTIQQRGTTCASSSTQQVTAVSQSSTSSSSNDGAYLNSWVSMFGEYRKVTFVAA